LLDRRALVEQLELEERGLADQRLGARRVLHAGQLDQDLIRSLSRDRRLAHAKLVDAIADRLETLANRIVAQLPDTALEHHQPEAPGGPVLVAALERIELRHAGPRVIPRLRVGQLDQDRGVPLARDPLDGDTLALER